LNLSLDFPVSINFGEVKLYLHVILEFLAFIVGFRYYVFLRKRNSDSISNLNRIFILVGATAGALIFSRLIGALESPSQFFSGDESIEYYVTNKTIIGGLIGGLIGVELVKKWISERTSSGDLFTYPIILALIIGRLGCFSMGVYEPTYGNETDFLTGMDLGDGLKRHPTTLYEIVFLILLWVSLKFAEQKLVFESGARFKFFMVSLFLFRGLIEFIRPGERIFGLTVIQICCVLGLIYYYKVWLQPQKQILHAKSK